MVAEGLAAHIEQDGVRFAQLAASSRLDLHGQRHTGLFVVNDEIDTVVIGERAENDGPSTTSDARHLAELIGRQLDVDPAQAYWIFHWGAFSYNGAQPNQRKELFLRATFRRTKNQSLGTPSWRVVTREEVEAYTDRQFR